MHPSLDTLRKLEKDTLRRVLEIGEFGKLPQLQAAAEVAAASINENRGPVDVNLGFTLDIRLRGDRRGKAIPRRLDLGALVQASEDKRTIRNATYSLMICRSAEPTTSPIVRKVHFDYEPEEFRHEGEPKPSVHLQMCGKLSGHHHRAGYKDVRLDALYPSWEKPRIPLPPTSLALLLNWIFLEFQSDSASQAILRSPTWRKWVAATEREILLPYFRAATVFLTSAAHREMRFLQSHLYGMTAG